ncbi:universal stress protein [Streptomyces natalensis]|uniref:Stress protein n=1 Tax=Streptomyces natalensis ATCC 27448 TaxID=1240678 RepID=A0A0D7CT13_9ACTN|nr:universal stress protein [Streptomyces natalensis]KIZ18542.1 stress protein [Streptomyces natalensis ATCC 27448]
MADSGSLPVVVAVDGSVDGERALRWAAEAARLRSVTLRVVHVWPYVAAHQVADDDATGDPVLDELRAQPLTRSLPEVEFRSLSGLTGAQLPTLGDAAHLLVLGSRGRGGFDGLLLGSNGLVCADRSACPVVVVPRPDRAGTRRDEDGEPLPPDVPQVTLGLDASAGEPGAVGFALAEASLRGARLKIVSGCAWPERVPPVVAAGAVHAATQREYEAALDARLSGVLAPYRARYPEADIEVELRNADAAGQLVAASRDSDLVVVGRRRRLGPVAHAVLLHAACPIAVVPEQPEPTG